MENTIGEKSYCFSVRIVRLYRFLNCEKNEPIIARQILKSGTSIGANVEEQWEVVLVRIFQTNSVLLTKNAGKQNTG